MTHDYRLVALLGLIPALSIWCARGEDVPAWLRRTLCGAFVLLMVCAMRIKPFTTLSFVNLAQVLAAFSFLFLGRKFVVLEMQFPDHRYRRRRLQP